MPVLVCIPVTITCTVYAANVGFEDLQLSPSGTQPWEEALLRVKPRASPEDQEAAVEGLAQRLLKDRASEFSFTVDLSLGPEGKDTFQVVSPGAKSSVDIKGNSGVAAAWGLLHYLKYFCGSHVSWEADQVALPTPLPAAQVNVTSNDKFRYYQNVCTVSYSMAWWDWARWEREIDWMALNGINIPLAFTGQEAIWQRVYTKMGIKQEELDEHFAGPAFLAWGRMGNIRGWGGPLPESWHTKTLTLQHQILERMRQFGMTPILPAFAGHVPAGLTRIFPDANVTRLGSWCNFNSTYSQTYLLDPADPLFKQIGADFVEECFNDSEFRTDHLYNCDTFNEMTPGSSDPEHLRSVGASIYKPRKSSDPDAIWVMQGWLFLNTGFWQIPQAKALLNSVPIGRMLILDLATEIYPQYSRLSSYFGQPFVACMLHDFGGVDGLFGRVEAVIPHILAARDFPNSTLVGTGLTPEGINQNYVVYDLMNEMAWRTTPPNMTIWTASYAARRYGTADQRLINAWQLLMVGTTETSTLFFFPDMVFHCRCRRSLDNIVDVMKDSLRFPDKMIPPEEVTALEDSPEEREESQEDSQESGESEEVTGEEDLNGEGSQMLTRNPVTSLEGISVTEQKTFLHDVVDVSRQMLQILAGQTVIKMINSYKKGDLTGVQKAHEDALMILSDMDDILATSPDFLLGVWTESAASWATNEQERRLYVFNALNQITTWGPDANILDYAGKQWSGLISHYIKPRWELFGNQLIESLQKGTPFDQGAFNKQVFEQIEDPLSKDVDVSYPSEPTGDTIAMALDLHQKYRPFFNATISFA
ncbi:LOW QUALITY PROTEIN: alpha-N-acetylglucosaminidase-like [Macrobrachium rosenbergii]|uniref:LOW QUALITY PROTEIN: alpha-N-acetylglucosaminidase-like n=1 Tax=Macrobrachium rosenbergii TaxID=79674 RepID=UPI0034D3B1F8